MKKQTIIALKFLLVMTILTGVFYPLLMTGIAQLSFPSKSNGSLIIRDGRIIGSELIGQKFDSSIYFWSRPSATGYGALPSGASNYGPTSGTLKKQVVERRNYFAEKNSVKDLSLVPPEMIFASGSGLDPDISVKSALLQVDRIVRCRNLNDSRKADLIKIIGTMAKKPQFGFLGEERINVLNLNLALDNLDKMKINNYK
jgi:potassium-transporting ATPase KdpC subunit